MPAIRHVVQTVIACMVALGVLSAEATAQNAASPPPADECAALAAPFSGSSGVRWLELDTERAMTGC
jgi:hypothetical protein